MTLRIALTPGEPAGIGPDLVAILAQHGNDHEIVVIADPQLLQQRAAKLGLPVKIRTFDPQQSPRPMEYGQVCVASVKLAVPCSAGELNARNAAYVLRTLDSAIDYCQQGIADALVTGPVHKGIIREGMVSDGKKADNNQANFTGHTEYLAQQTGTDHVVMMLATKGLRVALATTHIPLADVPSAITQDSLSATVRVLHHALRRDFGLKQPRLLVCGLNPHAGEGGHMGREEIEVIEPVLNRLRDEGMSLTGPLPADTLFTPKVLEQGDAVLAMYHDQGLPVLKYKGFGRAVNITLGLPIIRTSVDHGTALDIAGTGKADTGSLETALQWAIDMAHARVKNGAAKKLSP